MLKVFIASALVVLMASIGAEAIFKEPEQNHPGRPLSVVPYKSPLQKPKKFRPIVRAKFKTNVKTPNFGAKVKGCNRIPPTGGDCDGLQYYGPDWTGYANGIANRDL